MRDDGTNLLTYPGMTFVAAIFFGRWTDKLNLKAMYYDDSLVVDEMIDEYTRPTQKDGFWNMLSALSHQYFSSRFDQMQNNYHRSEIPLLIVWGEKDAWVPLDTANKLHERIPNSRLLTVPNCGHNPHEECPERVNPVVV